MRILAALLAFCIVLGACRKPSEKNGGNILGKWQMSETFRIGFPWKTVNPAEQEYFEFRSDGTFSFTPSLIASTLPCEGKFRTSGDTLWMDWNCQPAQPYTMMIIYDVNNNTLLLDYIETSSGYKTKYRKM